MIGSLPILKAKYSDKNIIKIYRHSIAKNGKTVTSNYNTNPLLKQQQQKTPALILS